MMKLLWKKFPPAHYYELQDLSRIMHHLAQGNLDFEKKSRKIKSEKSVLKSLIIVSIPMSLMKKEQKPDLIDSSKDKLLP